MRDGAYAPTLRDGAYPLTVRDGAYPLTFRDGANPPTLRSDLDEAKFLDSLRSLGMTVRRTRELAPS